MKSYLRYTLKYCLFGVLAVALLLGLSLGYRKFLEKETGFYFPTFRADQTTYVIDAGHGGEDPGASSENGVLEKDLNLQVSEKLADLLILGGYQVCMTRTEDTLLYDAYHDLSDYHGQKKMYDLKNRLKKTTEFSSPVYVGIHMNHFSASQYSGLQVYYSKNDGASKRLAEAIQGYHVLYVQPNNTRKIKQATSSIYILDRIETPGVLIECGFLSNEEELKSLCDETYQKQLCLSAFCALTEQNN